MTDFILTPEIARRLAGSLLHFIWQGAAIAAVASIALRLSNRRSAEVRYVLSVAALVLMIAAPTLTFLFYQETGSLALRVIQLAGKAMRDTSQSAATSQVAVTAAWTGWILATWSVGVFAFTARLVAGWRLSRRLVKEADTLIPESVLQLFARITRELELGTPIRLMNHAKIDTPMVVGCLRPVVLLPFSALTGLNLEQLTAILAHELAHIRRHDFAINILQRCVESLLFYHPAVWWLSAKIRMEREHCCDGYAVRICGDRRLYAQALVELERKRRPIPVVSMAAADGSLVQRVHRILGIQTSSADWQSAAVTLMFVAAWLFAGAWQSSGTLQARPVTVVPAAAAAVALPLEIAPAPVAQAVRAIEAIVTAQPTLEPHAAPSNGTIEGVVISETSGEPLAGAEVRLGLFVGRSSTPSPPGWTEVTPDARVSPVTTGPDGHFSLKDVEAGTYRITVAADGFIRQEYGQKAAYGVGRPVYLAAGEILKGVTVRLQSTGVVNGRILQESGQPARGAEVHVLRASYSSQGRRLTSVGMATADDRGEYRIHSIAPGRYYVVAGTQPGSSRAFVAVGNPNVGRVQDYALTYYPGVADVERATMIDVNPASDLRIDMRVAKRQALHIRGRIMDSATSRPPDSVEISLMFSSVDGYSLAMPLPSKYDPGTGDFDMPGVPPGDYVLQAVNRNIAAVDTNNQETPRARGLDRARQPMALVSVSVSDTDVNNLSLVISAGVAVPGRLVVEGQAPVDLSRFLIRMQLVASGRGSGSVAQASAASADGTFSFSGVQNGNYRLQVEGLASGFYLKSVKYAGENALTRPIRVSNSRDVLEVTVQRGTGTLKGIVTDSRNDPVSGTPIAVVPDQRELVDNYRIGLAGQDGRFAIGNIPPGSYKVFSWEVSELGAYFDPTFVGRYEQQGRSVVINSESESNTEVKLIPPLP
jgi:beta-lactamase regulating signal transducer with metallopeptidase domain